MTAPQVRTPGGNRANAEDREQQTSGIVQPDADAGKAEATATAELALMGVEARRVERDIYELLHAGSRIGVVAGVDALQAAARGFAAARADVLAMVHRLREAKQ